jgi:hypothetical protein
LLGFQRSTGNHLTVSTATLPFTPLLDKNNFAFLLNLKVPRDWKNLSIFGSMAAYAVSIQKCFKRGILGEKESF